MQVHLVQMETIWANPQKNRQKILDLLYNANIQAGDLILLPELFSTGFLTQKEHFTQLNQPDLFFQDEKFLKELAIQKSGFVFGSVLHQRAPKHQNVGLAYSPQGEQILQYAKIHPFPPGGESEFYEPGNKIGVTQMGPFTVQAAICFDLRFPELFRAGLEKNVNFYLIPANWPQKRQKHWEILLQARAIENQAYVAGVNRVGIGGKIQYSGGSALIDPKGEPIIKAGDQEGIFSGEINEKSVAGWRKAFPALVSRKPQNFSWLGL